MVWWINQHKHSVSIVHIFRFISFKAFCKFLRLGNSAWDFWGVNLWSRDFLGAFVGSPRDFFGYWFLPPFDHPYHLKSRVSPALGEGEFIHKRHLFDITYIHVWPMRWAPFWGRLVIRAWVYSRKYSNCLKSCTWYKCEATNHHRIEVTQRRCYKYKFEIPESHLQCLPVKCPATVHGHLGWV